MGKLTDFLSGPIAPIVQAGSGIIQGLINRGTQVKVNEQNNAANMALAQYSYSKDLDMWNRQNDYNSPANQMARYKAAGLNPNLIYGQGNSGNASQMPRFNAPTLRYDQDPAIDIPQALSMYQDFKLKQAQIDNVKAQTDNTNVIAGLNSLRKTYQDLLNGYYPELTGQKLRIMSWQEDSERHGSNIKRYDAAWKNELLRNQVEKLKADTAAALQNSNFRKKENEWYEKNKVAGILLRGLSLVH